MSIVVPSPRHWSKLAGAVAAAVVAAAFAAPSPAAAQPLRYCADPFGYCENRVSDACLTPGGGADAATCDEQWLDFDNCVENVEKICETAAQPAPPAPPEVSRTATGLEDGTYCPPGEGRVALVIGNSRYGPSMSSLKNPGADADLMADTLRKLCFEVVAAKDLTQNEMKRTIADFGDALDRATGRKVALVFYAGHGVQLNGVNYLIPTNAEIERERDVGIWGVPIDLAVEEMRRAGAAVNLVFLDACRDNPFMETAGQFRGGGTRGLARMDAPRGTMIAYATAPGDVAADGVGSNSPFTEALARAIVKPNTLIEASMNEVRESVFTSTEERQVPWTSSSLIGKFYFLRRG